jgi:alanine racemase
VYANVGALRAFLGPQTRLMAVVKADAYGHGLVPVAQAATSAGAEWLGVATVAEGATLRAAGLDAPIVLLCAPVPDEAEAILAHRLIPTVGDQALIKALAHAASARQAPAEIHMEIDTGMGRSGVLLEDALELWRAATNAGLRVTGLTTHFADADGPDPSLSLHQEATFRKVHAVLTQAGAQFDTIHLSNSAATLRFPNHHADLVRPGLLLYGILPPLPHTEQQEEERDRSYPNKTEHQNSRSNVLAYVTPFPSEERAAREGGRGVRPILTLKARVATVRALPAGHTISYGATHRLARPTLVATVLIGYGDGYPRCLSNRGHLLLRGRRAPILGRVCMDQTVVDVSDIPDVVPGDIAVCIGAQGDERIRVEEIAQLIETTEHEITTCLTARIPRVYLP